MLIEIIDLVIYQCPHHKDIVYWISHKSSCGIDNTVKCEQVQVIIILICFLVVIFFVRNELFVYEKARRGFGKG